MTADDPAALTDLAEAEELVRRYLAAHGDDAMERVLAEYDRRGTDLARANVRAQQHANSTSWAAREAVGHMRKADDLADQRDVLSSLLRGMARRATSLRTTGEAEIKRLQDEIATLRGEKAHHA